MLAVGQKIRKHSVRIRFMLGYKIWPSFNQTISNLRKQGSILMFGKFTFTVSPTDFNLEIYTKMAEIFLIMV